MQSLSIISLENRERSMPTTEASPIPLITTYGVGMPNITNMMRKHRDTLLSSPLVKEVMSSQPLVAYRRPENIKDQLVRASIKYPTTTHTVNTPAPKWCTKYNCSYCKTLKLQTTVICPHTGENVKLPKNVHCQTTNVVYLLYCKEHKKQFVGETKRCFKIRLDKHQTQMWQTSQQPL